MIAHTGPAVSAVDLAFEANAALEADGRDAGRPRYRKDYRPGYCAAFVYDPVGHNIEAVWYDYAAATSEGRQSPTAG
jgi:hypothetical protein